MIRKCGTLVAVVGAIVSCVGSARATLYTIGDGGLDWGFGLSIDGISESGGVGGIALTSGSGTIISVCTDISGVVYLGSSYNYVQVAFSAQGGLDGLNPNWGFGNPGTGVLTPAQKAVASEAIQNAAYLFYEHQSVLTGGSVADKAALQLAVWEALYDTGNPLGFSFGTGRFDASGGSATETAALATALSWLTTDVGLDGTKSHLQFSGNLLQAQDLSGNPQTGVQEMLFNLTPVPEASTVIAGLMLLLPMGVATTRIWRRNR